MIDKGMTFKPDLKNMKLDCYIDADYAGFWNVEEVQDPVRIKSRTEYVLNLGGCPLIWVPKLQMEIALLTVDAEYIALSQSMRDLISMMRLVTCHSRGS
jgi:hypothetical protein